MSVRCIGILICCWMGWCAGQPAPADDSFQDIARLVRGLVLETIPSQFEDDRTWGQQREFWAGVEVRREGMRLETKRKWETLNHGTWRKYSVTMADPHRALEVKIHDVHSNAPGHFGVELEFAAPVEWEARQSQWERGIQLISLSAYGTASVRLKVNFELTISMERHDGRNMVCFKPQVTDAELVVDEFRVRRVSKLGGEFAQQVTTLARRQLNQRLAGFNEQLVAKINQKLSSKQDRMNLPMDTWFKLPDWQPGGQLGANGWVDDDTIRLRK
ncbi:MAG TPA: hypothetical protein PKD54_00165 [Pirellulaceae bacterium]|nr:hypothetical protein [Pirellulaceae bacterium]